MEIKLKNIICYNKESFVAWRIRDFLDMEKRRIKAKTIVNTFFYLEFHIFPMFMCVKLKIYLNYNYYHATEEFVNILDLFHLEKIYNKLMNRRSLIWIKN